MKHALSAPCLLFALLAGCAAEREHERAYDMRFAAETKSEQPSPVATLPVSRPGPASSVRPAEPKAGRWETSDRGQLLRKERRVYAQGLEKILLSNGVGVSVLAYEGQASPTPTLIFLGHFSREFVHRALTNGAVLERARELGFRSVEFFDRGPDRHYQFVLSRTGPLPKCAAFNRLCL